MEKGSITHSLLDIVRAVVVALIVNLILVLVVAAVAKYTSISSTAALAVNQVCKVVAITVGTLFGFRSKRFGLVLGIVAGLLYTVAAMGIFSLLGGTPLFASSNVFDYLLGAGAGAVAGVLTVNLRTLEHKPRPGRRSV